VYFYYFCFFIFLSESPFLSFGYLETSLVRDWTNTSTKRATKTKQPKHGEGTPTQKKNQKKQLLRPDIGPSIAIQRLGVMWVNTGRCCNIVRTAFVLLICAQSIDRQLSTSPNVVAGDKLDMERLTPKIEPRIAESPCFCAAGTGSTPCPF